VLMATHEAAFVDQMQRRVIELRDGEMVRDETHGGYGDRSMIPQLVPEEERGAAATAALTAVQEVQRQTESLEPLTSEMIASMKAARDAEAAAERESAAVQPASTPVGPHTHPIVLP